MLPVENVRRWRHKAGDCDPWSEPEGSQHLGWKERFDLACREVAFTDPATGELVAELGAAFLCADLGLELTPRPDHVSYIDSWLKVLKDDRRFIFAAAAHAKRAAEFLHQRQATILAA